MNFRLGDGAERPEKIEVAAFVGLADVLRIKRAIAAPMAARETSA
jgi:hypothetical protein